MRNATVAVALAAAACVTTAKGNHVTQRQSLAQIEPAARDQLFARALSTLQRRGWIIAVSDRDGGLLTTQLTATGAKACGTTTCDSSTALQVAISETVISVNLHREFINPYTGTRFAPTLEQDVVTIEAEQKAILDEILSGPRAGPVPASTGTGVMKCCKVCTVGKPCGDTCISKEYTCHVGPGCAC